MIPYQIPNAQEQDVLLQWPRFNAEDEAAVLRILRDGNVSTHPVIGELENAFAAWSGRKYALAHCNGTAALLAAFFALGLEPGDEVLVPTATFWASALPMVWCGLVPVFCDSEPDTLAIDPEDARGRITPRTKAIVIVHLWGLPAKVDALRKLADRHGLAIIEDASHAHGAAVNDRKCGTFGDLSIFSLQGDKLVPAGEGGVLLTDNAELYERALCLGDITRIIKLPTAARRFAATSFGVKTRIAPMSAALGLQMLHRLPETNALRKRHHEQLSHALEALGFDCFLPRPGVERVYFEFMIRHRDPAFEVGPLIDRLTAMGCRISRPRYPLLHEQPFFAENHDAALGRYPARPHASQSFAQAARENARIIRLPNFSQPGAKCLINPYAEAFRYALG